MAYFRSDGREFYVSKTGSFPVATTLEVNDSNELAVKDGVVAMPIATSSTLGGVIPDGTVITVSDTGAITVPHATSSARGVVKQALAQADSTETDVAGLNTNLNALLAKLRTAGILAV
jgi:hypothetical protein